MLKWCVQADMTTLGIGQHEFILAVTNDYYLLLVNKNKIFLNVKVHT